MGDVFSSIHPGMLGSKAIEFVGSDLLPIFPEGLSFLIDFKREITGHDDRGLETLVYAAEEATVGAVATVTNVGKALGIDVLAPRRRSAAGRRFTSCCTSTAICWSFNGVLSSAKLG